MDAMEAAADEGMAACESIRSALVSDEDRAAFDDVIEALSAAYGARERDWLENALERVVRRLPEGDDYASDELKAYAYLDDDWNEGIGEEGDEEEDEDDDDDDDEEAAAPAAAAAQAAAARAEAAAAAEAVRAEGEADSEDAEEGDADQRPVVVLCHGAGGSHAVWYQQIPEIGEKYRVVTWDSRGFGNSTNRTDRLLTSENAAHDLSAVLNKLEISDAHLVGQSMGGWHVSAFVTLFSDRVRSVTYADTIGGLWTDDLRQAHEQFVAAGHLPRRS